MKYEIRYGDLFFEDQHIADGTGTFAIALDNDPQTPMLLKTGRTDLVIKWADNARQKMNSLNPLFNNIEVLILPVHPKIVDEVNKCRETCGRIAKFKEFLENLGKAHPEIQIPPQI